MANPNARGKKGNKGGGRLGYTSEKEQLIRLRKIVDRGIAKVEAIEKGKISEKGVDTFKTVLPVFLKAMDKLHANKSEIKADLEVKSKIVKLDE